MEVTRSTKNDIISTKIQMYCSYWERFLASAEILGQTTRFPPLEGAKCMRKCTCHYILCLSDTYATEVTFFGDVVISLQWLTIYDVEVDWVSLISFLY